MRDPWFPIALLIIVLLVVWLGIIGPMPGGFSSWLQSWQTLAAALVASIAAFIAFRNTSLTLKQSEKLESHRRNRKHAAIRAVLPLALAQVTNYAARSVHALNNLVNLCVDESLPVEIAPKELAEPLPSETLKSLAEFIEYSDSIDVSILESTVAAIQIHDSRMRSLVQDNQDPSSGRVILKIEIENYIIDAASIYAGAASAFDYARRRQPHLPTTLPWDSVRGALRNMRFWDEHFTALYEALDRLEMTSSGPFEKLNVTN